MKLYIAKWPNGTFTILSASSKKDLFFKLDEEGDPSEAEIQHINFLNDEIHITTNFVTERKNGEAKPVLNEDGFPTIELGFGDYSTGDEIKTRKVSFA
jgi:hypothetical protein